LVSNPKIIMLDEPYAGVDPITKQSMRPIIHQLQDAGISVLITDHDAQEILRSVNRCYVIDEGKVFCEGDPETVRRDPQVRSKYLGELADLEPVISAHQRVDVPSDPRPTVPTPKKGIFERLSPRRRPV
jgi:lipopolysaccharide export system ATP-binding protein